MEDDHLDTIPATGSDEVIKSSVEDLVPIPSESEGIPEHMCDVPFHDNSPPLDSGVENLIPIPSKSEGIPKHVCDVPSHDNSPPLDVSNDQVEDFSESNKEFSSIDDDSFSIDDIDYVKASPPDSELVSSEDQTKSLKFLDHSPTTPYDISLSEYGSFIFDLSINPFHPADRSDSYEFTDELIPVISALEYDFVPPYLLSLRNEDIIFDPGICKSTFSKPDISHR
nr:hypothetical protein [Tanacetum cinerariifolium]